jgi:hypothetical protein
MDKYLAIEFFELHEGLADEPRRPVLLHLDQVNLHTIAMSVKEPRNNKPM